MLVTVWFDESDIALPAIGRGNVANQSCSKAQLHIPILQAISDLESNVVRLSKDRRETLKASIFQLIETMSVETAVELGEHLEAFPYPDISHERRAYNLLVREAFKLMIDAQLKQDGNRDRIKRLSIGTACPFCNEPMTELKEIELDHECYDGRPPRPVHKSCHKRHQPH